MINDMVTEENVGCNSDTDIAYKHMRVELAGAEGPPGAGWPEGVLVKPRERSTTSRDGDHNQTRLMRHTSDVLLQLQAIQCRSTMQTISRRPSLLTIAFLTQTF